MGMLKEFGDDGAYVYRMLAIPVAKPKHGRELVALDHIKTE